MTEIFYSGEQAGQFDRRDNQDISGLGENEAFACSSDQRRNTSLTNVHHSARI
jgi:hypothetical protein